MSLKKIVVVATLLSPFNLFSQIIPVSQARILPTGTSVTVRGIVTNGSELGKIRYLQDGTAGIAAFPGTGSVPGFDTTVQPGDSIEVTGPTVSYHGLLEINPVTSWQVISTGNTLPAPKPVLLSQLSDGLESQVVTIECAVFSDAGGIFANTGVYEIVDAHGVSAKTYLGNDHPLQNTNVPGAAVHLTAIVSEYEDFQLLPRSANDFEATSCFYISENPQQSDIQTTGFKVSWETNLPASAKLRYGAAPTFSDEINLVTPSPSHSVELTGLAPGRIYWIQIEALHDGDVILSKTVPFATRSLSSGEIKIYFNHSVDIPAAGGLLPDGQSFGEVLDETVARIDAAAHTIDVAMYNNNREDLIEALEQAQARGVRVRYVAALDASNPALEPAPSFPVIYGNVQALMHNKFMIVDADMTDQCWVMSGSLNWTTGNMTNDFNNTLFIQDQSLARAYELEFEEMWGGGDAQPNPENSRFGAAKMDNTPHRFIVGSVPLESWFSPSDHATRYITEAILTADSEAMFAMFSYTKDEPSAALLEVMDHGVQLRGIIENINDPGAEFNYMLSQGVNVKHHNSPGDMHHKYVVLDADAPNSAPVIVTGSHNWTLSAETANDENTLVIHDADIALLYKAEFERRWSEIAVSTKSPVSLQVKTFPNPVSDVLNFQSEPAVSGNILIKNILGNTVLQVTADGSRTTRLNTGYLSPGFYFAVIETPHGIATVSFQKV
jgi:hypothetical protein